MHCDKRVFHVIKNLTGSTIKYLPQSANMKTDFYFLDRKTDIAVFITCNKSI